MSTENKNQNDSEESKITQASDETKSSAANSNNVGSGTKQDEGTASKESSKDSSNNIDPAKEPDVASTSKEFSVTKIFAALKDQTIKMKNCRDDIAKIKSTSSQLKARKKEIQKALESIGNVSHKINVLGVKKTKLGAEDRLFLKAEKEFIKNELILLIEQKWIKMKELKQLVGSNITTSKNTQLRNKSMSNSYTSRNRWSIEGRVIDTLNKGLKSHNEALLALYKLAISEDEAATKAFSESLSDFLDTVDSETYILCSHQLKNDMHTSIKLTLKEWDAVNAPEFTKLNYPEKQ